MRLFDLRERDRDRERGRGGRVGRRGERKKERERENMYERTCFQKDVYTYTRKNDSN